MELLPLLATILTIHLLAVISPGPDFIVVTKNALTSGKTSGIWTALGIALALLVHITYSVIGIGAIIAESIVAFNAIKLLGAAYLIYLGYKSFSSKGQTSLTKAGKTKTRSALKSFQDGFICNLLNPKAALYFLSFFALVLPPDVTLLQMAVISTAIVITTFVWFGIVAIGLGNPKVQAGFLQYENIFNKTFGGILIALGIKVATSQK